jgi:hypothetical protein
MKKSPPPPPPSSPAFPDPLESPKKKSGSGEHPAMADAIRQIEETAAHLLPELRAATERLDNAVKAATDTPSPKQLADHERRATDLVSYGLWTVAIRGRGPHHNDDPRDIERAAAAFVMELRKMGHDVEIAQAKFDVGSVVDVSSAPDTLRTLKKGNP